jgi:hypothetical protein
MSRLGRWLRRSRRRPHGNLAPRLDRCFDCGEGFVYPLDWSESGPADWWLHLRCGACGTSREVVASNRAVEEFDRQLDGEMETIEAAADRLARESLLAEADAFGAALRLDLLTADDFR